MSSDRIELALAFLSSQPGSAARLLEQQPMKDVASFFERIPHTHAAMVLERMLPQYTARICELLEADRSAGFLSRMDVSLVAAILRYSRSDKAKQIKALLPNRIRLGCQILLNYSEDAVGAWMAPNVSTLPNDCTVTEALERISKEDVYEDLDSVFVVDRDGHLQGLLNAKALLVAKPDSTISTIMKRGPRFLLGRSTLAAAKDHVGWTTRDAMPVVTRKNQLVGVIRHVDMRRGISQLARPTNHLPATGVFAQVCGAYASCFVALANTLGGGRNT